MPDDSLVEIEFHVNRIRLIQADCLASAVHEARHLIGLGCSHPSKRVEAEVEDCALGERAPVFVGELELLTFLCGSLHVRFTGISAQALERRRVRDHRLAIAAVTFFELGALTIFLESDLATLLSRHGDWSDEEAGP